MVGHKIELVEQAAHDTDPELAGYILLSVTEGMPWTELEITEEIPCSRGTFYDRYRKFFWILDQCREYYNSCNRNYCSITKGDFMKNYSEEINKLDKDIRDLCEKAKMLVERADSQADFVDYEHDIDEAIRLVSNASKLDKKKRKYIIKQVKHEKDNLIAHFIMDIQSKRPII